MDLSRTNDLNKAPVIKKLKSMLLHSEAVADVSTLIAFSFDCFLKAVETHSSVLFIVTTKALTTREDTLRKRKLVHDVFWVWTDPLVAHLDTKNSQNTASVAKMLHLLDTSRILMATNDDLWKEHLIQLGRLVQKCLPNFNRYLEILEALMQTEYSLVTNELARIETNLIAGIVANDTVIVNFTISRIKVAARAHDLASVLKGWMHAIVKLDKLPTSSFPKSLQITVGTAVKSSLTATQAISILEQTTTLIEKINRETDDSAASRLSSIIKIIAIVLDNCQISEKQQGKVNEVVQHLFDVLLSTSTLNNLKASTLNHRNSKLQSLLIAETDSLCSLLLVAENLRSTIHEHLESPAAKFIRFSDLKWLQTATNVDYITFASLLRYVVCILDTGSELSSDLKDITCKVFKLVFAVFEVLVARVDGTQWQTWNGQLYNITEENIATSIWDITVRDSIYLLNSANDEENLASFAKVLLTTLNVSTIGSFRHLRSTSQALLNRADFWELPNVRSAFIEQLINMLQSVSTKAKVDDTWADKFQLFNNKADLAINLVDIIAALPNNALDRRARATVLNALVFLGGTSSNSVAAAVRARQCLGDFVSKAGSTKGLEITSLLNDEWLEVQLDQDERLHERLAFHENTIYALQAIFKHYFASKRDTGRVEEGDKDELLVKFNRMKLNMDHFSQEISDNIHRVTTLDWTAVLLLPYMSGTCKDKLMQNLRTTLEWVFTEVDMSARHLPLVLLLCKVAMPFVKEDGLRLAGIQSCSKAMSVQDYYEKLPPFWAFYGTFVDVMIDSFNLSHLVNSSRLPADVALALLVGPDESHTINNKAVAHFTTKLNEEAYKQVCQVCLVAHRAQWKDSTRRQKLTDLLTIVLGNKPDDCRLIARSLHSDLVHSVCNRLSQPLSLDNLAKQSDLLLTLENLINMKDTTIQAREVNTIFVIVTTWLAPHKQHVEHGEPSIFQTLCRIILPICRSYRHVIIKSLPLVTRMLQLMLRCLAAPRQDIQIPADSLVEHPIWLNPLHVQSLLGSVEAEMVARILTTLCWKTPITSKSSHEASVSLIKPFSKHAPSVLGEFIRIETDRLLRISIEGHEHRRNMLDVLGPGIWALCEVIGQHERDALIVTLNSAGKALLQSVWSDWSKYGKYTGQ